MSAIATYRRRISRSLEGCRLKPSFGLCLFEEGFDFDLFGFLIALPFLDRWRYEPHEIMEQWRVYYFEKSLVLHFGRRRKSFYMPWMLEQVKHEVQRSDGSWVPYVPEYDQSREPDGRHVETYPYHYMTRNGDVQHCNATIYVERREYRWRKAQWLPLFAKRSQEIHVSFSAEVGERSGSWKGGCIGCWYGMRKNETAKECLMRMQDERRFT